MNGHHVRRWTDADGYSASCTCGWRCCRRTRDARDQDATRHPDDAPDQTEHVPSVEDQLLVFDSWAHRAMLERDRMIRAAHDGRDAP